MHVLIRLTTNVVCEFAQVTALRSVFVQATRVTHLIEAKQNRIHPPSESIEKEAYSPNPPELPQNGQCSGYHFFFPSRPVVYLFRPTRVSVKRIKRRGDTRPIATATAIQKPPVRSQSKGLCSPLANERSIIPSTLRHEWLGDKGSCAFLLRGESHLFSCHP